jgi:hypothetical protein
VLLNGNMPSDNTKEHNQMREISFEEVLAALQATIADPTNAEKRAKLNHLSEQSLAHTVHTVEKEIKRQMRERH